MKLVLLHPRNNGFLYSLARAVLEAFQAMPSGMGLVKSGPVGLVQVPVLAQPRVLREEPRSRNWRA